ncbi:zinc-ribbon domain-containing protein [Peptoniphilus equinus]|uniref:Zinc-ribbon domain-containing protein n=1 Tax=Peptoniphilus equinus TaxID=3016343 RepID=A0ABY7QV07_9FIRM|nr:zinc-ribbon domain-containing protein [Peptoniphilus equinus]WBW49738.1 zinc-ribbon domain-containing protein [Peptoniphilus equinus]
MKEKFYRFMQGRYGAMYGSDTLSRVLMVLVIASFAVGRALHVQTAYVTLLLIVYMYFRLFSKNITGRYNENRKVQQALNAVTAPFSKLKRRLGDRENKYVSCPSCHQELRIPKGKGRIKVTCPKCGHKFDGRS